MEILENFLELSFSDRMEKMSELDTILNSRYRRMIDTHKENPFTTSLIKIEIIEIKKLAKNLIKKNCNQSTFFNFCERVSKFLD